MVQLRGRSAMAGSSDRKITLKDGRTLGWGEYGDPHGWPLLYCHGFPASRLEAALTDEAASHLGLRVIAPDRPGIGLSDFQPGRSIGDWPADVAELADFLGLGRFGVLGVSGGAPYALACAAKIPERLATVGIVGGLGPLEIPGGTAGMAALNSFFLLLFGRAPVLGRALFEPLALAIRHWPRQLFACFTATVPPVDRAALDRPGIRPLFHASMGEALRQGARGAVRELDLYSLPWGFDLGSIRLAVHLWHGERDVTVPAAMGRHLAAAMPRCRPQYLPEDGHFSLPLNHMGEILSALAESNRPVGVEDRPSSYFPMK